MRRLYKLINASKFEKLQSVLLKKNYKREKDRRDKLRQFYYLILFTSQSRLTINLNFVLKDLF